MRDVTRLQNRSFRPQVDSAHVVPAQVDPALNKKSIRPHLKLNTFELKYTSVYHFKMFLIDLNIKNSNIRIVVCNEEINVAILVK